MLPVQVLVSRIPVPELPYSILFFFYKKLADYFGGGGRVITLQERGGYNDTRVGIQIYDTKYWMNEKEFYTMRNEPMPKMTYTEQVNDKG